MSRPTRGTATSSFGVRRHRTLAVVCLPMGTWVGGLYTLDALRTLAARGARLMSVAPGNNVGEILRILPELAPHVEQVVLLGYPPFLKEVIDAGNRAGTPWLAWNVKLVFAGEVFSERWRDMVIARCGADPVRGMAALNGTAGAGVLGAESPGTIALRRAASLRPKLAHAPSAGVKHRYTR